LLAGVGIDLGFAGIRSLVAKQDEVLVAIVVHCYYIPSLCL
jgi:hypothetical protein